MLDRLAARRRATTTRCASRYLLAIALLGTGLLATAASPALPLAMLAFSVAGVGNGLFLVTVRVLMQKLIPEAAHGRAFGLLDAIDSWGFGAAIVGGGALAASIGGRATFAIAGALALLVLFFAYRTTSREEVHHGPQVVDDDSPFGLASYGPLASAARSCRLTGLVPGPTKSSPDDSSATPCGLGRARVVARRLPWRSAGTPA